MNRVIIWNKENNQDNNFLVITLLILFNILKISICIYYHDLSSIYYMGIYYFFYFFLEYVFFKLFRSNNIGNYFLLNCLIISFIVPSKLPIYMFFLGCTLGILIRYISKDRISSSISLLLFIYIYLSWIDNLNIASYIGTFRIIYLVLCIISFIFLARKKIIKRYLPLVLILFYFITNRSVINNSIFIIIFMVADTRYNALTKRGEMVSIILLSTFYCLFSYFFYLDYALVISTFLCELGVIMINKNSL